MVSVPLGYVGAGVFLAPAFGAAELRPRTLLFVIAGSAAGALHAISGAMLAPLAAMPGWLTLSLGYLPYAFRPEVTLAFGFGAVGAGLLAGYAYARIRTATGVGRAAPGMSP